MELPPAPAAGDVLGARPCRTAPLKNEAARVLQLSTGIEALLAWNGLSVPAGRGGGFTPRPAWRPELQGAMSAMPAALAHFNQLPMAILPPSKVPPGWHRASSYSFPALSWETCS